MTGPRPNPDTIMLRLIDVLESLTILLERPRGNVCRESAKLNYDHFMGWVYPVAVSSKFEVAGQLESVVFAVRTEFHLGSGNKSSKRLATRCR
jgi:hypothetical protein